MAGPTTRGPFPWFPRSKRSRSCKSGLEGLGATRRDGGVSKTSTAEITKEETGVKGPGRRGLGCGGRGRRAVTGKQLASPGVSEVGGMAENQAFLPEEGVGGRGCVDRTALALPSERLLCSLVGQTLMLFFSREDTGAQSCWESCPRSQTPRAERAFNSPTPPQVRGPSREGLGPLPLLLERGTSHPEHSAHRERSSALPHLRL